MILIARHGQTNWNLARRWQSRSDIPLNAMGEKQAKALADHLRDAPCKLQRLICSPLARAKTTAQILGATLSLDIEVDARLTELDLGEWEGKFEADLRAEDSDFYDQWRSEGFLLPPPGGESLKDVADRLTPLVAEIQAFPGDVLIVGHKGANMAFKAVLTGCFSAACLDGFRQDNDEIDIWELSPARSVRKIKATVDP
mgnify:FL=1